MSVAEILIGIAVMAAVTYLCRALTLLLVRKKITNRFILSILTYIPFAVLAAMVFPSVFYATASLISAVVGTVVACLLALFKRGLLTVSLAATLAVFLTELILKANGII